MAFSRVLLLGAVLLSACAAPYQAPIRGATATLLMDAPANSGLSVVTTYVEPTQCEGPRTFASYGGFSKSSGLTKETIPGDQLSTFNVRMQFMNRVCELAFSFHARANRSYAVAPAVFGDMCTVRLADVTDKDAPFAVKLVKRDRLFPLLSPAGKHCRPLPASEVPTISDSSPRNASGVDMNDLRGLLPAR
jgi:hypothetical protein